MDFINRIFQFSGLTFDIIIMIFFFVSFIIMIFIESFINDEEDEEDEIDEKIDNEKNKYQKLLEFPDDYYFGKEDLLKLDDNPIKLRMKEYIEKYKFKNIILSLSGGVDSMVVLGILINLKIKDKMTFNLITASINYNQRVESTEEIDFVKEYVSKYKIDNKSKKVEGVSRKKDDSGGRREFEETSQKIRYDLYNEIIKEKEWNNDETVIMLGHHQDDLRENIFNNFMLGRNLTDLEVMKELTNKNGLNFGRPLLMFEKKDIYKISYDLNIPFFLDTTPDWSKRGLMRRQLFPLLEKIYGKFEMKLDIQGKRSRDLESVLNNEFLLKFEKDLLMEDKEKEKIIIFNKNKYQEKSKLIWGLRLSNILHNEGLKMISQKSLEIFIKKIINKKEIKGECNLGKNIYVGKLSDEKIYLKLIK